jgi:uncharacterized membrane protein
MKEMLRNIVKKIRSPEGDVFFENSKQRKAAIIISIALIVASFVIGWNYYDIMWWISWYKIIERNGISSILAIYSLCQPPACKVPYPPLTVLTFISIYAFAMLAPYQLRYLILKLCLVVIPALMVFCIIKRVRGFDVALVWLLSLPLIQILFALQFDVLIAMLILLSTMYIASKKYSKASIVLALATLTKHVIAIILPLHIIFIYRKEGLEKTVRYVLTFILIVLAFCMPFYIASGSGFLNNLVGFHSSRPPQDLSVWALSTYILECTISKYNKVLDNLWVIPFAITYFIVLYIMQKKLKRECKHRDSLSIITVFTSLLLLLFITFSKVGNLNYFVWIVPTSLIALDLQRMKKFTLLITMFVLFVSLPYSLLLWFIPATSYEQTFIAEDIGYWDARAVFVQSINYYVIYALSLLQQYVITPIAPVHTAVPSDVLELLQYMGILNAVKKTLIVAFIIVAQFFLISLIFLHLDVLKGEYT